MSPRKNPQSYPTPTSAEATAIEQLMEHFKRNPHEAPATLLEVQKGKLFKRAQQKEEDRIPSYQNIGQLSSECMKSISSALMPELTEQVWQRIQRANKPAAGDPDKTRVESKIFYKLTGEKPTGPLVCCSKALLTEIYLAQANERATKRSIVLNADFTLDLEKGGCYDWGPEHQTCDSEVVYKTVVHSSGVSAALPERRLFLKGKVELRKNYLDDGCFIYDTEDKTSLKVLDRFVGSGAAPFLISAKSIAKNATFKTRVEENLDLDNKKLDLEEEDNEKKGVCVRQKKRKLMRVGSLSDMQVPQTLAAPSAAGSSGGGANVDPEARGDA